MELEVKTLRRELCAWASNPPEALSAQRVAKHNKIITQLILKNILHLIKKIMSGNSNLQTLMCFCLDLE